jgi:membrane protease YdiL (CAAX protease family)
MSSSAFATAPVASTPNPSSEARIARWQHLALVLWVSLSMPVLTSVYYLLAGNADTGQTYQGYRIWGGLIPEVSGLLVLWYVMKHQGKSWKDIGWNPSFADMRRAVGLFVASTMAIWVAYIPAQYIYRVYSGAFLKQKSLNSTLAFGITALPILFVCINPFFEELIVRAYTISELTNLGTRRTLAIVISVAVQLSYHLYQGIANILVLAVMFTVFSVYYSRTRRIVPVILVHLGLDVFWLFKANI